MADSYLKYVASSMRSYYKDFSKYAKGRAPECKVAWVTSFTPVEILDCLGIEYIYPHMPFVVRCRLFACHERSFHKDIAQC